MHEATTNALAGAGSACVSSANSIGLSGFGAHIENASTLAAASVDHHAAEEALDAGLQAVYDANAALYAQVSPDDARGLVEAAATLLASTGIDMTGIVEDLDVIELAEVRNAVSQYTGVARGSERSGYGRSTASIESVVNPPPPVVPSNALLFGYFRTDPEADVAASYILSQDTVIHELTHQTLSTLGFAYDTNAESGALHESLGDVMATVFDVDWVVGEDKGFVTRDLSEPNSIDHVITHGEVHDLAKYPNYAAHLIGTELGRETLVAIYGHAIQNGMGDVDSFESFAQATIDSAIELYGADSDEVRVVQEAWYEVLPYTHPDFEPAPVTPPSGGYAPPAGGTPDRNDY